MITKPFDASKYLSAAEMTETKAPARVMGDKPYPWTDAIEMEMLERIAKGEAVRNICADDWLPSWPTFRRRLIEDADFATRYAIARDAQADSLFDETEAIARAATPETVQVARLQIDTIKWRAGKLRPKVYGDKVDIEHSGKIQVEGIDMTFVNAAKAKDGPDI